MAKKNEQEQIVSNRPKVIVLCGSTRFIDHMAVKAWELEKKGNIVLGPHLLPLWYCKKAAHLAEEQGVKIQMDELHLRKIDMADGVYIINPDGYIGESTQREIEYALDNGVPVEYEEPLPRR